MGVCSKALHRERRRALRVPEGPSWTCCVLMILLAAPTPGGPIRRLRTQPTTGRCWNVGRWMMEHPSRRLCGNNWRPWRRVRSSGPASTARERRPSTPPLHGPRSPCMIRRTVLRPSRHRTSRRQRRGLEVSVSSRWTWAWPGRSWRATLFWQLSLEGVRLFQWLSVALAPGRSRPGRRGRRWGNSWPMARGARRSVLQRNKSPILGFSAVLLALVWRTI